jgi:3-deoxy-D-manno-octulosonate 8-phosphate phosphatase (KDO 8-P phosphatase)
MLKPFCRAFFMTELENLYGVLGGRFISPASDIKNKLQDVKAFVFDWDGVFNNGQKTMGGGSCFSEVDSMGLNLLRFSYFLKNNTLPITGVLSGEKNDTAFYFCERECLHYSLFKIPHKLEALKFLCEKEKLIPGQIAYFFDDVLDIPVAEVCGLRIMVNQKANPLFINYCKKNNLVDYLTASQGGSFAVREATELLIGLNENFDEVITGRKNNSEAYQNYIQSRRKVKAEFFTLVENKIEQSAFPLK